IYAIIKGIGTNNDGGGKGSFTAPSAEGQAGAIRQALADAAVDPATISYVEAHGTATPLGDPIELEGLALAFGELAARHVLAAPTPGETVFLFPGQGAQYVGMGRGLYEHEPAYRQAVDECAALLLAAGELDIRQLGRVCGGPLGGRVLAGRCAAAGSCPWPAGERAAARQYAVGAPARRASNGFAAPWPRFGRYQRPPPVRGGWPRRGHRHLRPPARWAGHPEQSTGYQPCLSFGHDGAGACQLWAAGRKRSAE
nr:polyketide synthase [Tanacetum cinerariifolium]